MAFRRQTNQAAFQYTNTSPASPVNDDLDPASPTMRKRQRTLDILPANPAADPQAHPGTVTDDAFINDQDAVDSAAEDDDEEEKPKSDKKAGRRKIKIEFIQDKSRRHITFSKRKAGKSLSPPSRARPSSFFQEL
jgi:hypothetical protein